MVQLEVERGQVAVVVSAMSGVTNRLVAHVDKIMRCDWREVRRRRVDRRAGAIGLLAWR